MSEKIICVQCALNVPEINSFLFEVLSMPKYYLSNVSAFVNIALWHNDSAAAHRKSLIYTIPVRGGLERVELFITHSSFIHDTWITQRVFVGILCKALNPLQHTVEAVIFFDRMLDGKSFVSTTRPSSTTYTQTCAREMKQLVVHKTQAVSTKFTFFKFSL